jgi:hypothetical protein
MGTFWWRLAQCSAAVSSWWLAVTMGNPVLANRLLGRHARPMQAVASQTSVSWVSVTRAFPRASLAMNQKNVAANDARRIFAVKALIPPVPTTQSVVNRIPASMVSVPIPVTRLSGRYARRMKAVASHWSAFRVSVTRAFPWAGLVKTLLNVVAIDARRVIAVTSLVPPAPSTLTVVGLLPASTAPVPAAAMTPSVQATRMATVSASERFSTCALSTRAA